MTNDHSFEDSARKCCDKYDVPEPTRGAFVGLGSAMDRRRTALELVVLSRAYNEMYKAVEELYRPRTPLEAQLEYIRARKERLAETGIDMGEWKPE